MDIPHSSGSIIGINPSLIIIFTVSNCCLTTFSIPKELLDLMTDLIFVPNISLFWQSSMFQQGQGLVSLFE